MKIFFSLLFVIALGCGKTQVGNPSSMTGTNETTVPDPAMTATQGTNKLEAPTNLRILETSPDNDYVIGWDYGDTKSINGFVIEVRLNGEGESNFTILKSVSKKTMSFKTGVSKNASKTFRVKAYNNNEYSDPSNELLLKPI